MNNLIIIEVKEIYGRELIYPLNPTAIALTLLTKKKTLDRADLVIIESLGYQIFEIKNKAWRKS